MRRGLSRPIAHLESLEKRRRGQAKAPSMFKSTTGAVGTMGGRVAGAAAQYGLLKTIIPPAPPPPLPVARRALSRPIPRAFAPFKAIKNVFNSTSRASSRFYRKSAPARKKGKVVLISFMDGITKGITG
ncbi:hypothetical protein M378DRAFT_160114 [Amanita muscaria Koide BX008]|uniref:Uncharacterized protein n=1 Tax=Amanita muscaria (strain Koide BX008) TaxID=946122 RepID=A0A0C2TJF4_AMAMK|nr:hypothetical protein M378DRAFT_160114 [Amanita muscaria Koide BX008]